MCLSLSSRCLQMIFLCLFRIWQSRCCPSFPDTDGTFGILPVLSAGRGLGLSNHHQHGTDEASVRQQNKLLQTSYHRSGISTTHLFFFFKGSIVKQCLLCAKCRIDQSCWHCKFLDCQLKLRTVFQKEKHDKNLRNSCKSVFNIEML